MNHHLYCEMIHQTNRKMNIIFFREAPRLTRFGFRGIEAFYFNFIDIGLLQHRTLIRTRVCQLRDNKNRITGLCDTLIRFFS